MDMAELLVTVGGVVLIVLTLWFFLGGRRSSSRASSSMYSCPMHPWITSDKPSASCSLCGMPLVHQGGGG
jgi:hypothetical protein